MAKHLSGKVAIVTGSTAGIGLAIARKLGLDGASVVISSRKQQNVDKAVEQLKQSGINVGGTVCHVGKSDDREKLVDFALKKFGHIDIFVSNAAINPHFGSLLDVDETTWDKLFDTNVKAGFLLSKLVVPHMEKRNGGNIIFVSSVAGYQPFPGILAYGLTKTTLLGLTKALAITCAPMKIRVNCIAPGVIKTDFSSALWDHPTESQDAKVTDMIPMNRLGEADDCSGIVSFLCSDAAAYITGETVTVSGGINCRL